MLTTEKLDFFRQHIQECWDCNNHSMNELLAEIDRLLENEVSDRMNDKVRRNEIDKLRDKLAVAIQALGWYANSKNIDPETGVHGTIRQCNHPLDPIEYDFDPDGGARAEEAISKIRGNNET